MYQACGKSSSRWAVPGPRGDTGSYPKERSVWYDPPDMNVTRLRAGLTAISFTVTGAAFLTVLFAGVLLVSTTAVAQATDTTEATDTTAALYIGQPLSIEPLRVEPRALLVRDGSRSGELVERPSLREATGPNTYLTSAAVDSSSAAPHRILVSTTFQGLFESVDGGITWRDLGGANEIGALYLGNGFYEDIAAVAYDRNDRNLLWVEYAQTGRIAAIDRRYGRVVEPAATGTSAAEGAGSSLFAATYRAPQIEQPPLDGAARQRRTLAANQISFYLSPWQLSPERLAAHMDFARAHGFTAVVIDFKDDDGRLVYDSKLELPRTTGAVRPLASAARIIDTVHDAGLYLIARVVVFKDRHLYGYDNNRYALWDGKQDVPWGVYRQVENEEGETDIVQTEHWVDPFSEFVWDYNIAIAQELEELGVDEIQFDYIRTPAEGRVENIEYRYRQDSPALADAPTFTDDRVAALSMFLERAREELSLPLGVDVFGFNGWYRMNYLGQDIAALARHVDVISPMLYPSHFPRAFRSELPYLEWAEWLYRDGTARGRRITDGHVLIRPYVQAFLIGGELKFELPTYTDYLKRQIRGAIDGGASGFTLWNNSGRYYMVEKGLWYDQ
jgi:hypothetical protein